MLHIGEGQCNCSECGEIYCGAIQNKEKKLMWKSPCCKAKGINWKKVVMVDDNETNKNKE